MKRAEFTIETGKLLIEVARHFSGGAISDAPGIVTGMNEIRAGLARIAKRAAELGDAELIAECERLCLLRRVPQAGVS